MKTLNWSTSARLFARAQKILPGGVDIVPATVVAGGNAEFGISWVPKMLASRESGADVQVIGQGL